MKRLLIICLSLPTALFAADEIIDRLSVPPQACRVVAYYLRDAEVTEQADGTRRYKVKDLSGCSATVVGKRDLIFAGHCVPDEEERGDYRMRVICPGGVEANVAGKPKLHPKFDVANHRRFRVLQEKKKKNAPPLTADEKLEYERRMRTAFQYDLALLKVDKDLGIDPALIPSDEKKWTEVLEGKRCLFYGFGAEAVKKDSEPRRFRGLLYRPAEAARIQGLGEFPEDHSRIAILTERETQQGDSGGGLLCRDEHGRWYAMSVFSALHGKLEWKGDERVAWSDGRLAQMDKLQYASLNNTFVAAEWAAREGVGPTANPAPMHQLNLPAPATEPEGPVGTRRPKKNH